MAHTRKDSYVKCNDMWDHLRPENKRFVAKRERIEAKKMIRDEIESPDEVAEKGLGLTKAISTMRKLIFEKGISVIPKGDYCYRGKCCCPYWDSASNVEEQSNGFCWFLGKGDWMPPEEGGTFLLWDQCKECGENEWDEDCFASRLEEHRVSLDLSVIQKNKKDEDYENL